MRGELPGEGDALDEFLTRAPLALQTCGHTTMPDREGGRGPRRRLQSEREEETRDRAERGSAVRGSDQASVAAEEDPLRRTGKNPNAVSYRLLRISARLWPLLPSDARSLSRRASSLRPFPIRSARPRVERRTPPSRNIRGGRADRPAARCCDSAPRRAARTPGRPGPGRERDPSDSDA